MKSARRDVDPNQGFIKQVKQFAEMGFALEGDDPVHAQYRSLRAFKSRRNTALLGADMDLAVDPRKSTSKREQLRLNVR